MEINVSVRQIVEFILRSGSIQSGFMSLSRMQDGVRIHQMIQKARKKEAAVRGLTYDSEVRLKLGFEYNNFMITVSGIADGIYKNESGDVYIEEIKSTLADVSKIDSDESHWHMAQAKCYGHMYAEQYGIDELMINLTYCNVETEHMRTFEKSFSAGELKAFFYDIIGRYYKWAEMEHTKLETRNVSIKSLPFPYDSYRKGQRQFSVLVYRAIQNGKSLFIEAPTGTGKTVSALFPAIKSLAEGLTTKLFYLTAKTITRQAAESSINRMISKGCSLSYTSLTAKDKICFLPERMCDPAICEYANGHYFRVNDALWALLNENSAINRTVVERYARDYTVCPYELMLDATLFADIIICDYNYAFDPTSSLKRYFGDDKPNGKYALLIDESHNLVERSREMFSAELKRSAFSDARKAFKSLDTHIYRILNKIYAAFRKISDTVPQGETTLATSQTPDALCAELTNFTERMDIWLGQNQHTPEFSLFMDLYFKVLDFLRAAGGFNERYTVFIERSSSDVVVSLMCLDPSENLAATLKKTVGSVFFSATLTPVEYFKNILGGNEGSNTVRLPSPFDAGNLCAVIEPRISTKYRDRGVAGYERASDAIYAMTAAKRGNYFAFFSSFEYMDNVRAVFTSKYPEIETICQERNMSEEEREGFLEKFKSDKGSAILAFAVLGGVFSEGIDLAGERLLGAAIVSVGLPLITRKRDALRDYYERTLSSGFEYAYMYPGMNKVLQAAGRVIRTESDRGVVLLIDGRFQSDRYLRLFPYEWRFYKIPHANKELSGIFAEFWNHTE